MKKEYPAIELAYDKLHDEIAKGLWSTGQQLPSLDRLADHCGVSRLTVFKALLRLKSEKLVVSIKGAGYYVKTCSANIVAREKTLWRRVVSQLCSDLQSGHMRTCCELPAAKQLQKLYGCSRPTLNKVLHYLVEQKILISSCRKSIVNRGVSRNNKSRILFITAQRLTEISETNFTSLSMSSFISYFESECTRRNVEFVPAFMGDTALIRKLLNDKMTLGTVVYFLREKINDFIHVFTDASGPIAFLDDFIFADMTCFEQYALSRLMGMFSIDHIGAGEMVGQTLIKNGYTQAVFVSPFHKEYYPTLRYQGLAKAFKQAGIAKSPFLISNEKDEIDIYRMFLQRLRKENGSGRAVKEVLSKAHWNEGTAILDQYFDKDEMKWVLEQDFWFSQFEQAYRAEMWTEIIPLLDDAVNKLTNIECWVCANDAIALITKRFLELRKVKNSRVIGFDNTTYAVYNRFSSYSFTIDSIAAKMLDWVLVNAGNHYKKGLEQVLLRGVVIERNMVNG